ncbi:MAG: DsrE family protein [Pseudomonadota bacterium]
MKTLMAVMLCLGLSAPVLGAGKPVATPYAPARVLFDFYFDDPQKIGSALFWVRSLVNTLQSPPYDHPPEDNRVVVVIHGTEIVTVAKHNAAKYQEAVDRMRYYAGLGVSFKVCGQAMADFGYRIEDFQDFIEVVPNAITELAHWQQQGYALIVPQIQDKRFDIESIR